MSVTNRVDPNQFYPVYNRNYFKLTDSNCVNPDFKYIVRLYYRTDSTAAYTAIGTWPVYPMPDGSLIFDPHPILREYVSNSYYYLFTQYRYRSDLIQWKAVVTTQDSLGVTERTCWTFDNNYSFDGAVSLAEETIFYSKIWQRIKPATTHTINRSLSNIPTTLHLNRTDYYSADFFINDLSSTFVLTMILETTDSNGVNRKYGKSITSADNLVLHSIASIGIGPMNVAAVTWNVLDPVGAGQPFTYDVVNYDIYLMSNYGDNCTCNYNVILDCNKLIYHNKHDLNRTWLIYKSRLGGWSYLLFNLKSSKTIDIKKTTYDRKLLYNETFTSRGITTIGSDITVTRLFNSDWVTADQQYFFEDLFVSPQVYMLTTYVDGVANTTNPFVPVTIKDKSQPIYDITNSGLFQYQVEVTEAGSYITHLR